MCPLCRAPLPGVEELTLASDLQKGDKDVEVEEAVSPDRAASKSSKINAVLDELRELANSDPNGKIVIFSQFTSFLAILGKHLNDNGFQFNQIVGSMSQKARKESLDEFASAQGPKILLASIKAAGTGLNLLCANNVFLIDVWWNSAVEEQAIDRVHRIGQRKAVRVVRFICKDTIEERVKLVQESKNELIKQILTAKNSRELSIERLKRMKLLLE